MLDRCNTGGPISFRVEVVSAQYGYSVRPLAGDPYHFSSVKVVLMFRSLMFLLSFSLTIIFTMVAVHH